jgi:sedoheptulokinase
MSKSAEKDIYLTVGTGAQLSVVIPASAAGQKLPESVDPRPFPGGGFLAVAAPLCGGQAFAWLVKSVKAMSAELGLGELKEDDLYPKIDALAMACPPGSGLKISPNFLGERHAPDIRGAVSGLTLGNLSIGAAARALAEGIMMNMRSMTPAEFFAGRETVVGSGNALRRLAVMRRAAEDVFGLPLVMPDTREEAASGAALLAAKLV